MNKLSDKLFRTTDLNLTAALMSSGHSLKDLNKLNERQLEFIFEMSDDISVVEKQYWDNKLLVMARTMADNIKFLKARIYSLNSK